MRRTALTGASMALATVMLVSLSGCSESVPEASTATTAPFTCSSTALLDCARQSVLGPYVPDEPTKATGEPIDLGMINQENTPAGSFPELSQAVKAGVEFINEEMGGVERPPHRARGLQHRVLGRGIHLVRPGVRRGEESRRARRHRRVRQRHRHAGRQRHPLRRRHPVSSQSVTSPNSFQWSGGSRGAAVAFAWYAAEELKAKKVSIVYGEFGSITDSAEAAEKVLERQRGRRAAGPVPDLSTDLSSAAHRRGVHHPGRAVRPRRRRRVQGRRSTACRPSDSTAATFYVGACAAPSIIDEVGAEKTNGAIFNVEGPLGDDPPDARHRSSTRAVIDEVRRRARSRRRRHGVVPLVHEPLRHPERARRRDHARRRSPRHSRPQVDAPSFSGHPYTCDGEQFDGLPALCSPQQVLAQMQDGKLAQVTDWIDVGQIYNG